MSHCNHLELNYDRVKGYNKLSPPAQKVFKETYMRHNDALGRTKKYEESPIAVKEKKKCLEVALRNGDHTHYYPNYSWG